MIDVELHGGPHDGRHHTALTRDAVLRIPTVNRHADETMPDITYDVYRRLGRENDGRLVFEREPS
ncbi:hypothetical protein [Gordonia sp. MMO-8]|uniref:hypothetical protein n=1 Tax=Gordonia sp. MMO-8 TaxID=3127886 RepID=UPI003015F05D